MSAAFTPGPWEAGLDRGYGHPFALTPNIIINPVILGRAVNIPLAKIRRGNAESYANAILIAAAPELLAALRDCLMYLERDVPLSGSAAERKNAHAAIAKATGSQS